MTLNSDRPRRDLSRALQPLRPVIVPRTRHALICNTFDRNPGPCNCNQEVVTVLWYKQDGLMVSLDRQARS